MSAPKQSFSVGVIGATGSLGKEVLGVLNSVKWRPDHVVAMASSATSTPFVSYGDTELPVEDVNVENFDHLDAVIMAVPPKIAKEIGDAAVRDAARVVDCSGALHESMGAPLVIPWVNPEALQESALGVISLPSAPGILLASVLGPLCRAGLTGLVNATVMVSASDKGRGGIEELSRQVAALFNSATPPRRVFESGLAFDLLPQWGSPGESGWTDREQQVVQEVTSIVPWTGEVCATMMGVPIFSGIGMDLAIHNLRGVEIEKVASILEAGGVRVISSQSVRELPRPRRIEGEPFVHVGRLRWNPSGTSLHLYGGMDNLRVTACTAVACCGALLLDE
jgi:aspartate-semialdehyde dehydrogenase